MSRMFEAALWIATVGAGNVMIGMLMQFGAKRSNASLDQKQAFVLGTGVSATGILNLCGAVAVMSCALLVDFVLWMHK